MSGWKAFMLRKIWLGLMALLLSLLAMPVPQTKAAGCLKDSVLGVPTWYKYFDSQEDSSGRCSVKLPAEKDEDGNTITDEDGNETTDIGKTVGRIAVVATEILLRLASFVAAGYIIYGGYRFILSQGDPEGAKSARQTIINALIGLVISIAAAAIVGFVAKELTNPANESTPSHPETTGMHIDLERGTYA